MTSSMAFLVTMLVVITVAVEAIPQYRQVRASAGAFSGVSNGQHYGGTYHTPDNGPTVVNRFGNAPSNSYDDAPTYAPQFPFGPNVPPFVNPLDFSNFFQNYFKTLNDNLAYSAQKNTPHHSSSSSASLSFSGAPAHEEGTFSKNFEFQRAAFEAAQKAFQSTANNRFGNGGYGPNFDYGPGFSGGAAAAGASFGPGGGHQYAGVYPENPSNPNINTRFSSSGPGKPGFSGVSSSSFSTSSDIGGKKTSYKEASTTINDNGKITTHTVRN